MSSISPAIRSKRWFRSHTAILITLAIAAFLFVYPIVMLIVGAFRNTDPTLPADWGVHAFVNVYTNPRTYEVFGNSLLLAVSTTAVSLVLALYLAFLAARTTTPLRKLITPAAVVVLALPPTFFAISWGMLGNKSVGSMNQVLGMIVGGPVQLFDVNNWWGVIGVTILHTVAVKYLLLIGPFTALDRRLEEAAHVAGAGGLRTFFGIDLPVLAPTILGVTILSFVKGLEAFDVPAILGTKVGINVVSTEIYAMIQNNTPPDYGGASAMSISLLVVVIALVLFQWRMLGKREFTTVTGKSFSTERWNLGRWRYAGTVVIVLYILLAVILPGVQLVFGALQPYFGAKFGVITFDHLVAAVTVPALTDAIVLTLTLAVLCGAAAAAFSAVASYLMLRQRSGPARLLELSLWLPWAVPGVVLSLAFAWAFLAVPGLKTLYGTPWILGVALIVSAVPVAMRPIQGAIAQLSTELEDAARTSGASRVRVFFAIVLRIIAPSFIASWVVAAILVAGNLGVPALLSGIGNKTVPFLVFQTYNQGLVSEAAALLVVHLLITYAAVGVLAGLFRLSIVLGRRIQVGAAAPSAQ